MMFLDIFSCLFNTSQNTTRIQSSESIQHPSPIQMTLHSVRAKINAGEEGYEATAASAPAFLYEDPAKYDLEHILSSFMQGYFLVHVHGS